MMQLFKALILSDAVTPASGLLPLVLTPAASHQLLRQLPAALKISDLLILNGADRIEIYYSASQDYAEAISQAILPLLEANHYQATSLFMPEEAMRQLFETALLTEEQAGMAQVKQAYQWTADADTAGPFLHRLLHTIFFAHKRLTQQPVTETREAAVQTVITDSLADLRAWSSEMQYSGTMQKMEQALEQLRQEEMRRFSKKLSAAEAALLEEMTTAMVRRVLLQSTNQLQAACQRGEADTLSDVLTELFDLEKQAASV